MRLYVLKGFITFCWKKYAANQNRCEVNRRLILEREETLRAVRKAAENQKDRVQSLEDTLLVEQMRLAALSAARQRLLRETFGADDLLKLREDRS